MMKTKIGSIEVDLAEIKASMQNVQELTPQKCIINFRGQISQSTGRIEPRAPLVLDAPIAEVVELLNKAK